MKKHSKWDDTQIKKLFSVVEKTKSENKSLLEAFKIFAKKTGRKPNSVRNFYYQEVENLKNDAGRADELGICAKNHNISVAKKFSNEETKKLIKEILRQKCLGNSVRKACLNLANGDAGKMIRYQNKFRSVLCGNKKLYSECLEELRKEGLGEKEIKRSNVVFMKKQEEKKLSDDDINSLFLGLIRLVKRSAAQTAAKEFENESEFASNALRNSLSKLALANQKIEALSCELEKVKTRSSRLEDENIKLKTKIAQYLSDRVVSSNKSKSLAKYLREMKQNGAEIKTKI